MQKPIHLFVGTSANGEDADAELVWEYTLRKNTDRDLRIHWCRQSNDDTSFWSKDKKWETEEWTTPWTGFKWAIPEFCEFDGKAIYVDIGIMNEKDIGGLFDMEIPDDQWFMTTKDHRGHHDLSVMLFDNERFKDKFPSIKEWGKVPSHDLQFRDFFCLPNRNMNAVVGELPWEWNSINGNDQALNELELGDYSQINFNDQRTQPWTPNWFRGGFEKHHRIDLTDEFKKNLQEAKESGLEKFELLGSDRVKYYQFGN